MFIYTYTYLRIYCLLIPTGGTLTYPMNTISIQSACIRSAYKSSCLRARLSDTAREHKRRLENF